MKLFGKKKTEDEKPPTGQRPRIRGHVGAFYVQRASEAFIEVIMKASDAQRPGRIGAEHSSDVDRAQVLEAAVSVAALYCNEELLSRLHAFRDAVLELTMGGGSEAEVRAAREHFTKGCREALGTDQ